MQNDVLKNNIAPWQEQGRWYHATVSCNGTTWKIETAKSDEHFKNLSIVSTNYLVVSNNVKEIPLTFEVIFDANFPGSITYSKTLYYGNIRHDIILPSAASYVGEADVWVFIVNK